MVNKCMQLSLILLSLSLLGAIGLSFIFTKVPEQIIPIRDRLTGYPTWQGEIEGNYYCIRNKQKKIHVRFFIFSSSLLGFDPNRIDGMNFAANVVMLIAGIIGLKTIRNPPTKPKLITYFFPVPDDSDRDPTGVPT